MDSFTPFLVASFKIFKNDYFPLIRSLFLRPKMSINLPSVVLIVCESKIEKEHMMLKEIPCKRVKVKPKYLKQPDHQWKITTHMYFFLINKFLHIKS